MSRDRRNDEARLFQVARAKVVAYTRADFDDS